MLEYTEKAGVLQNFMILQDTRFLGYLLVTQLEGGALSTLTLGGRNAGAANLDGLQRAAMLAVVVISAVTDAALDAGVTGLVLIHTKNLLKVEPFGPAYGAYCFRRWFKYGPLSGRLFFGSGIFPL